MSFRVITPLTITDARLTSSSIAEPDAGEAVWNIATGYTLGQRVYLASNHILYENVMATTNTGNNPAVEVQNDPDNVPVKWLEIGRTNRWSMFNLLRTTQSVATSPMTVVLTPALRVDSIGLFGIDAGSVTVSMVSGVDTVYTATENLNTRQITDWFEYFFEPFSTKESFVRFDLPPITDAVTTVTLSSTTGTVKLGSLALGNQTSIGDVQYGASSDVINFSKISRAFDGTAQLLQRRSIPRNVTNIFADKSITDKLRLLRRELNAVPAVWAGIDQTDDDYFESLLILGIYTKFTINLDHPDATIVNLEIEEI